MSEELRNEMLQKIRKLKRNRNASSLGINKQIADIADSIIDNPEAFNPGLLTTGHSLWNGNGGRGEIDGHGLNFPMAAPFTIECWINNRNNHLSYDGGVGRPAVIYSRTGKDAQGNNKNMMLWTEKQKPIFTYGAESVVADWTPPSGATNVWYHYAVTVAANGDVKIYVDGSLEGDGNIEGIDATMTGPAVINARTNNDGEVQVGDDFHQQFWVTELRLWNTERTHSEILTFQKRRTFGTEAGCIGRWEIAAPDKYDDNIPELVWYDRSPYRNHMYGRGEGINPFTRNGPYNFF